MDHEDQVISTTDLHLDIIDESHNCHVNVKPAFSSLENETQGVNIMLKKSDEVKSKNQGGVVKANEEATSSHSKVKNICVCHNFIKCIYIRTNLLQ